jgi:methyltransferase (TIGR00027 family)
MSKKGVEQKPSETAVMAALHRAIANKEFGERLGPDYLAEYFLPSHFRFFIKFRKVRANVKNKLGTFLPGLHEYMMARTSHFDAAFMDALKNQVPQIVLLGAGYDSRAYRFARLNTTTKIFELDISPTQDRKKKCLKKASISIPQQTTLVPINFNEETLESVLEKAGYDNNQPTLFLWEGVSYYLEQESAAATLEFVAHTAHPKSAIIFDYVVSVSNENHDLFGASKFLQTMKDAHGSEALLFAISEGETASYLEKLGLKMIAHLDNEEIERTYLLNENGALLGHMTGLFRFVSASPNTETEMGRLLREVPSQSE